MNGKPPGKREPEPAPHRSGSAHRDPSKSVTGIRAVKAPSPAGAAFPTPAPQQVFCARVLLIAASRRGESLVPITNLLSYLYQARSNTLDVSFKRGREQLGIREGMHTPMALLRRAKQLGLLEDDDWKTISRRALDAWKAETSTRLWMERIALAAAALKNDKEACGERTEALRAFIATLTSPRPSGEAPWTPSVTLLKRSAESLGLLDAHVPIDQAKLCLAKVLRKLKGPLDDEQIESWRKFLGETECHLEAFAGLDSYQKAKIRAQRCREQRDQALDSIIITPPSAELDQALREFARLVDRVRGNLRSVT